MRPKKVPVTRQEQDFTTCIQYLNDPARKEFNQFGNVLFAGYEKDKILMKRFTFHELRHKAATEAKNVAGLEYARQLLGPSSQAMTERSVDVYNKVKPLK